MNEIEEINYYQEYPIEKARELYIKAIAGYYSIIDLSNDKCFFITHTKEDDKYYYFEFTLIKNTLEEIITTLSKEVNMDFIPLYSFNHTIISPELCTNFLMKQTYDIYNEKILNDSYYNIYKGD